MGAALPLQALWPTTGPFSLDDDAAYRRWRAWKIDHAAASADALVVEVADACRLTGAERSALLARVGRCNMALARAPDRGEDKGLTAALAAQLGLHRLDANWLADEDGVSSITVHRGGGRPSDGRGGFIPYTDRAIRWHTDGYYHPDARCIRSMVLHCVRPAAQGGDTALLDHELAYIGLRDASPDHVLALMQPDAMTIPAREDDDGIARAAQAGPVFSVDAAGALHMRYTARTRSIEWKADAATRAAVAALDALLAGACPWILRTRLEAGMSLVCHNVLHDRTAFVDDPQRPRQLYRARFLDRMAVPSEATWR